jgi:hypothetical protein
MAAIEPIMAVHIAAQATVGIAWLVAGTQLLWGMRGQKSQRTLLSASRRGLRLLFCGMIWVALRLFAACVDEVYDVDHVLIALDISLAGIVLFAWGAIRADLVILPSEFIPSAQDSLRPNGGRFSGMD